jgi:TetR/AcrR family transcriptional regulator, transcriptional repressor for nem operon
MSTRDALLEAGRELLWERGYSAMSPRDVLKRSGAGQGSLYHFFEGKEGLAAEAMRSVAAEVSERIAATCGPGSGTGLQRIERFLKAERDPLRGCRLGRMAQDPELPESLRRSVASGLAGLASVLERAVRDAQLEGELPPELDPGTLAETLIAVVQGGYVLARAHKSREPMTRVTNALWTTLNMLTVPGPPAVERQRELKRGRERSARKAELGKDRNGKSKPRI